MTNTKNKRKISYSFYIEASQLLALQQLSAETDIPIAVWMRRGIDRILEDVSKPVEEE